MIRLRVSDIAYRLKQLDVCSSYANAQALLSHALGCRDIDLYADQANLPAVKEDFIEDLIARRGKGEPLQYIIGNMNFYGNDIIIRKGVFIPRPETEILVDTIIDHAKARNQDTTKKYRPDILDLCTGSGNIAISLTKVLPECKIISSDISDAALCLARENADMHSVSDRIEFVKSNLFDLIDGFNRKFDIISCNPPYIARKDIEQLPVDVQQEPVAALDGGIDGMDFYRILARRSIDFLKDNGIVALEIPDNSRQDIEDIFKGPGYFSEIEFFNDLNGIERVAVAHLKKPNL
jgi:release factor glutamine methyltransferase